MSKKNRKKNKGNQSTKATQVAPVVTPEEAEVIEVIEDIIAEVVGEDNIIDVDAEEVFSEIVYKGEKKKITKAKLHPEKEKSSKKNKTKQSKSLLEKIGVEKMSEAPEFTSKEEILTGNQGEVTEKEDVVEKTDYVEGMVIINTLYIAVNANLLKHGIINKISLEDAVKIFDSDIKDTNAIANTIIKSIDFSGFDGKIAELIIELKSTILSWLSSIVPLMEKDGADTSMIKDLVEKLKGVTKDNYKVVLSSFGIDINFDDLVTQQIEQKTTPKASIPAPKTAPKASIPAPKTAPKASIPAPKTPPRGMSLAWYIVNGYGANAYEYMR